MFFTHDIKHIKTNPPKKQQQKNTQQKQTPIENIFRLDMQPSAANSRIIVYTATVLLLKLKCSQNKWSLSDLNTLALRRWSQTAQSPFATRAVSRRAYINNNNNNNEEL